jgi:UrcA family protein
MKHPTRAAGLMALALIASPAFFQSAQAEPSPVKASLAVSYADLDLADPHDARTLRRRIAAAAREVCSTRRRLPTNEAIVQHGCAAQALARASDEARVAVARAQAEPSGRLLTAR